MARIEKSAFISYRRATATGWALAISKDLIRHGYDAFLDFRNIGSGDFEQIIAGNIKARAHFLVLLTPSALERVGDPDDWLRREIEIALAHRRNVIPVMLDGFTFSNPSIAKHLKGKLKALKRYNGLTVAPEYFDAAMERLRDNYLNIPIEAVLHPPSAVAAEAATEQRAAVDTAPPVQSEQLSAEQLFERAFTAKAPSQAVQFYTEAIQLKPDYMTAYHNRGLARTAIGDLGGALADFDEVLRLKPDDAVAHNNRGNVFMLKGDIDAALAGYDEAIRLQPTYYSPYNNRGNLVRLHGGDETRALADLDEAIRLRPNYANAFYNRALLKRLRGDRSGTIADLQTYLALGGGIGDGDKKEVQDWIKELQSPEAARIQRLDEQDKSRKSTKTSYAKSIGSVASQPSGATPNLSAEEWFERGVDATEPDEEIRSFTEVIRLRPRDSNAYFNRGLARKAKGDFEGALKDFGEALHLDPRMGRAYITRANTFAAKGDFDAALSDYDHAIKVERLNPLAYKNRAHARRMKGDFEGAIADLAEAIRLKSDYAEAYFDRGLVSESKGSSDEAIADYTNAIRFDPNYAEAFNNRGVARRQKGDLLGALADYDEAISLNPKLVTAYHNRSIVRFKSGNVIGALADRIQVIRVYGVRAALPSAFKRWMEFDKR